jgi:hypothetical protein
MAGRVARLRIRDISYGHSPDRRGERTDKWSREPIAVRRRWLGGYKVIDGNDRLYYAAKRGQSRINATVWD